MKAKNLNENDIEYIKNNLELTASELSRRLDKPRPRIAKLLKELKNTDNLGTCPSVFNKDDIKFILLHREDMTYENIAKKLGKGTRSSVYRTIRKYVPDFKKPTSRPWTKDKDANFISLYDSHTYEELADIFERSVNTIITNALRLRLKKKSSKTSIETIVETYLIENSFNYVDEFPFENYRYDFYLKDFNTFIEVQGDYWHSNPKIYTDTSKLNDVQLSNLKRDVLKKLTSIHFGFNIIYIWEQDIKDNILNLQIFLDNEISKQLSP